jgi:hypothetical protein
LSRVSAAIIATHRKGGVATYDDGGKEGLALGERLAQPEARKQESCGAALMMVVVRGGESDVNSPKER